jgi:calcineurin-like phosphoesterase
MTGYYDGILGINRDEVIERFITSLPQRHVVPDDGRRHQIEHFFHHPAQHDVVVSL